MKTSDELINCGYDFGSKLKSGDVVFLNGPIGAGKTTFVKGIAQSLGIKETITSPTFSLIKSYDNKLCHVDAYRLQALEDIGLEIYEDEGYIICIEWGENIPQDFDKYYVVTINYIENGREVEIKKYG